MHDCKKVSLKRKTEGYAKRQTMFNRPVTDPVKFCDLSVMSVLSEGFLIANHVQRHFYFPHFDSHTGKLHSAQPKRNERVINPRG